MSSLTEAKDETKQNKTKQKKEQNTSLHVYPMCDMCLYSAAGKGRVDLLDADVGSLFQCRASHFEYEPHTLLSTR
jgi:uncharacterized protein YlaI